MPQSQWILLVAAALIAGVVLARLYFVLGRRSGPQPQAPNPLQSRPQNPVALNAPPPVDAGTGGLIDIQLADRDFEAAKFLEGARSAYGLIVRAFESGDRAALRPLLSDDVHEAFVGAIDARGAEPASHFATLQDARITATAVHDGVMEITVTFTANFDPPAGAPHVVTDVWTFARAVGAPNPNWTLVATSGEIQ